MLLMILVLRRNQLKTYVVANIVLGPARGAVEPNSQTLRHAEVVLDEPK